MALRGFDEYEVTLGDEMRGERASRAKTLGDVERDLCIRAAVIEAIENADLEGFPNRSVVSGYVRSYARYLGMDPERAFARFCAESGYRSPGTQTIAPGEARGQLRVLRPAEPDGAAALVQSRFAVRAQPSRLGRGVSFGGIASAAGLIGVVAGLGYGAYALLLDIQRVAFAPVPEAPAVVADAPIIVAPAPEPGLIRRPDAASYDEGGALAALAAPAELPLPVMPERDGPISAINPATSGLFAALAPSVPPSGVDPRGDQIAPDRAALAGATDGERLALASPAPAPGPEAPAPAGIVLHATAEAWVRIQDGDETILFEGTLRPGQRVPLPAGVVEPQLRVGNAGAVFVLIDGTPYGPVGAPGRVVKNFSLTPADVRAATPAATVDLVPAPPAGDEPYHQAEASTAG